MKYNRVINFAISTALLASIVLSGCSGQKVYVYEKIPETSECRRYTEYFQVSKCNPVSYTHLTLPTICSV